MDQNQEPIYPVNPVANMAEYVKQKNQVGRANPTPPPLDPPMDLDPDPGVIAPDPPFDKEEYDRKYPPETRGARQFVGARPQGPLTIDRLTFNAGKVMLGMNDGSSHEIAQAIAEQIVVLSLKAWELVTFSRMKEFGEAHGLKFQTPPQAPPQSSQNGQTEIPEKVARRGRPPKKA